MEKSITDEIHDTDEEPEHRSISAAATAHPEHTW